jgi:NTP pyrophosphatase (non-canonical NTP hydrolase)
MDLNKLGTDVEQFLENQELPHGNTLHGLQLGEEAGEVQRAILKGEQGIRGSREYWLGQLQKELADVVCTAAGIATHYGIDLESTVAAKRAHLLEMPPGALLEFRPAHE